MRRPLSDECILWTGKHTPQDYGYASVDGECKLIHRVMYEVFIGPIPEGMLVRHTCDVRNCVNPEHLAAGDYYDNWRDHMERHPCMEWFRETYGEAHKGNAP
ncbi:MAG: HNH endonuclease [bacterium]|nr:HNH endonuclease [bacterium]